MEIEYVNEVGCIAIFEDTIPPEKIKERLEWLGGKWKRKEGV